MVAKPNILVIVSDEHHARMTGYRGHARVKTPNLDRLAAEGTHFTRAYCNTPICGPSRISFMTGEYLFRSEMWCNGVPWDGAATTWASRLGEAGYRTVSRGKMDVPGPHTAVGFADFDEPRPRGSFKPWPMVKPRKQMLPTYREGGGMPLACAGTIREENLRREGLPLDKVYVAKDGGKALLVGHGDHDRHVTDQTLEFLREEHAQPWVLHIGHLNPHWPFVCPQKHWDLYGDEEIELPVDYAKPNMNLHPAIRHFQAGQGDFKRVVDDDHMRRLLRAYYGMISCMDEMVGEILDELGAQGQADNTYVIYVSDHGEAAGEHGLLGKLTPYEASAAVPLIVRGPGIPAGTVVDDVVSLVDLYPTILEMAGAEMTEADRATRPGESWLPLIAGKPHDRLDYAFAEYHGVYFADNWFMLVAGDYKYTYFVNDRPSLFNLTDDPDELNDLAEDPAQASRLAEFEQLLRSIVDPEAVAARARRSFGLITPEGVDLTKVPS